MAASFVLFGRRQRSRVCTLVLSLLLAAAFLTEVPSVQAARKSLTPSKSLTSSASPSAASASPSVTVSTITLAASSSSSSMPAARAVGIAFGVLLLVGLGGGAAFMFHARRRLATNALERRKGYRQELNKRSADSPSAPHATARRVDTVITGVHVPSTSLFSGSTTSKSAGSTASILSEQDPRPPSQPRKALLPKAHSARSSNAHSDAKPSVADVNRNFVAAALGVSRALMSKSELVRSNRQADAQDSDEEQYVQQRRTSADDHASFQGEDGVPAAAAAKSALSAAPAEAAVTAVSVAPLVSVTIAAAGAAVQEEHAAGGTGLNHATSESSDEAAIPSCVQPQQPRLRAFDHSSAFEDSAELSNLQLQLPADSAYYSDVCASPAGTGSVAGERAVSVTTKSDACSHVRLTPMFHVPLVHAQPSRKAHSRVSRRKKAQRAAKDAVPGVSQQPEHDQRATESTTPFLTPVTPELSGPEGTRRSDSAHSGSVTTHAAVFMDDSALESTGWQMTSQAADDLKGSQGERMRLSQSSIGKLKRSILTAMSGPRRQEAGKRTKAATAAAARNSTVTLSMSATTTVTVDSNSSVAEAPSNGRDIATPTDVVAVLLHGGTPASGSAEPQAQPGECESAQQPEPSIGWLTRGGFMSISPTQMLVTLHAGSPRQDASQSSDPPIGSQTAPATPMGPGPTATALSMIAPGPVFLQQPSSSFLVPTAPAPGTLLGALATGSHTGRTPSSAASQPLVLPETIASIMSASAIVKSRLFMPSTPAPFTPPTSTGWQPARAPGRLAATKRAAPALKPPASVTTAATDSRIMESMGADYNQSQLALSRLVRSTSAADPSQLRSRSMSSTGAPRRVLATASTAPSAANGYTILPGIARIDLLHQYVQRSAAQSAAATRKAAQGWQ